MEEKKVLISIIIPVYNVEQYLHECIDSVLCQKYRNIEVILVDDGATDSSGAICDGYAVKDCRVKVIHKQNGGLSDARNAGMQIATGDYIGFVDSDDIISENMYAVLLENALKSGADIAVCTYSEFTVRPVKAAGAAAIRKEFNKDEFLKIYICGSEQYKVTPSVWTRLYRRELIYDESFPKGRCFEDLVWSAQVIYNAEKIVYIDTPLYFYRKRESSITNDNNLYGINEKMLTDRIHEHKRLYKKMYALTYRDLADEARYTYVRMLAEYYCLIKSKRIKKFKNYLSQIKHELFEQREWISSFQRKSTGKRKKILLLIWISPNIFTLAWTMQQIAFTIVKRGK